MSASDSTRYQPVSVEDWDDEAQAPLPGTRTTANVAAKRDSLELDYLSSSAHLNYDGTDSGYGSKASTVSSMASSSRRRTSDLKIDTINLIERERKPYLVSAVRPKPDRQSSSRPKEKDAKDVKEAMEAKPVKKPFCHEKGKCWVCDKYGYHFDPKLLEKKDVPKAGPAQSSMTSQPTSQQIQQTRAVVPQKTKTDDIPRPPVRRTSTLQSRPVSMYVGTPVHPPFPQYAPNAWAAAATPVVAYSPYYVTPPTPMTPITHGYLPPQQYFYEPQPVFEELPAPPQPKIVRRLSTAPHERPALDKRPSRTSSVLERTVSQDKRPQVVSQLSQRALKSIDADRIAMPPPPKPSHATVAVARPRTGRAQTYHPSSTSHRRSRHEEEYDEEDYSDDEDLEDRVNLRAHAVHREPPSPSRPPSSYRQLALQELSERPQLQEKAQSYQDAAHTTRAAIGTRQDYMPRRRTTESVLVTERREAEAEAYIRKRGSMPVVDLTAENLKVLKSHITRNIPDQRSESGSTASHVTHHSSSKDSSSGRGRAASAMAHAQKTSMNINYNGLSLNITDGGGFDKENGPPVKIDLGAMQISMNNRDKENVDYRKQPIQFENGPNMLSHSSRRSLTSSSIVSANGQRRDRDDILALEPPVRRASYVEDEDDEVERTRELLQQMRRTSAKSSRQQSRETSNTRAVENRPVRRETFSNRSSVDYSLRRDEPVV